MVATRGWVIKHLQSNPLWVGIPAMIIVNDGAREDVLATLDRVVNSPVIDMYSVPVSEQDSLERW
jgi:hypothetical protein